MGLEKAPELKILYIVASAGYGGVETFIKQTAKYHSKDNIKIFYFFLKNGALADEIKKLGYEVQVLDRPFRLLNPFAYFFTLSKITHFIRDNKIQLVHSSQAYTALVGGIAAWIAKVPHLWFQHGPVAGWMDKLAALIPCKKILTNSEHTKFEQEQIQENVFSSRSVEIFQLGVDLEAFDQESYQNNNNLRKSLGMEENVIIFAVLARLQSWKGLHHFIRAMARIRYKYKRDDIQAVIVGSRLNEMDEVDYEKMIQTMVSELDCGVRIIESQLYPWKIMGAADAVINCSICPEPYGLTLIEAMSMGKLVIAANEGGPKEFIQNNVNGILFEARNIDDLVEKMSLVVESKVECERIANSAKIEAKEKFNIEDKISELETIYKDLL